MTHLDDTQSTLRRCDERQRLVVLDKVVPGLLESEQFDDGFNEPLLVSFVVGDRSFVLRQRHALFEQLPKQVSSKRGQAAKGKGTHLFDVPGERRNIVRQVLDHGAAVTSRAA